MASTDRQTSRRIARALAVLALPVLAASSCAVGSDDTDLFSALPMVFPNEVDPKDSFAELINDSDLVVVGHISKVEVEPIDTHTFVPGFVMASYKVIVTVTPTGGGEKVSYGDVLDVSPEDADEKIRQIVRAELPKGELLFALQMLEGWGYGCTSGDPGLCPIAIGPAGLTSPRVPDYPPFGDHVSVDGRTVGDLIRSVDSTVPISGVEDAATPTGTPSTGTTSRESAMPDPTASRTPAP